MLSLRRHFGLKLNMIMDGAVPKPNIITPSYGPQKDTIEKFLMMYTCKICSGRNAQMVNHTK